MSSESAADGLSSSSWRSFLRLLGDHKGEYLGVTVFAMLIGALEGLLHPLLIRAIFDEAASRDDFTRFIYLVIGYLVLGLGLNGAAFLVSLWQQKLDNRIVRKASADLLQAYYSKSYRDVLKDGVGHFVSRIRSDVKDGLVPMLSVVRQLLVKTAMFIALVVALLIISWQAFVVLAAIIPIATAVSLVVGKKVRELTRTERDKEARVLSVLTAAVGAFKTACTFGLQKKTVRAYDNDMADLLDSSYRRFKVVRSLQGASDLTMVISDVCSIFVGALFVFRQQMSFGSFIAFMNAFWRSATTLVAIFKHWAELESLGAIVARIDGFLRSAPPRPRTGSSDELVATSLAYAYEDVAVFSGFSMTATPGASILIIGDNGSGKTTLANILAGHLAPTQGNLSLPPRVSAVTLPLAFPPIRVSEMGADIALLERFELASAELMQSYPDQLSAGQQQKLALAMALTLDADLYVLDEPLANLDVRSRALAIEEIFRRAKGRMLVVIMHGSEEFHPLFDRVHALAPTDGAEREEAAVAL